MKISSRNIITPVAGAIATSLTPAQQALAQSDEDVLSLEEVIVTATKRDVSIQDIPATIQALTAESLESMGAKAMEDYARFIPSVNVVSYGSGSTTVVFRGAITGQGFIAASTSSVYLDEMSVTTTGSQPGIRMVDIERVEALSGPQGTLYGSDAQAGTLRIITNKPNMSAVEGNVSLEWRTGSESESSYRGSFVYNTPLIEDKLAIRLVGYKDRDGGFIDNVFGHTPDSSAVGATFPSGWGTLDNRDAVEKNWNDAEITGGRVILTWNINDNWSTSFTALAQKSEQGALNDFDPFVGDLQTVRFHDEYRDDDYEMYSFTVNGDLGFAQLVGAVNYYDREVDYFYDITAYAHYWAGIYCHDSYYNSDWAYAAYYWINPNTGYVVWWPVYCMGETLEEDFFSSYYSPAQQDKFTAEVRLSNDGDKFDWLVGMYYEDSTDSWQAPFATPTLGGDGSTNIYQNSLSLNYWEWYFGNTYPEATSHWYSQSDTDWEQEAIFGEVTWHINDKFDLTLGGRYFERSNNNKYIVDHPGDIGLNGEPDVGDSFTREFRLANGRPPNNKKEETEFIPKIALAYSLSEDSMIYGLYTRGKRPGGVNRSRGQPFFPIGYDADLMDNYEIGYRSYFADGKARLNATFYQMQWDDYQLELVDPSSENCPDIDPNLDAGDAIPGICGQPWQQIVTNAGEAHIDGIMVELDYAISESLTFGMNLETMEAETDTSKDLNGNGELDLVAGLRLPITPELKGAAWLDYTNQSEAFGGTEFFGRFQISYTGDSVSVLEPRGFDDPNPQFNTPSYTISDIRAGFRGEDWEFSLFINNITDERAIYTIENGLYEWGQASLKDGRPHIQRAYTNRPREFGVRYSKHFGG